MSDFEKFEKLNFGMRKKPASHSKLEVIFDPEVLVADWGKAYAADLQRRNPLKYEASFVDLSTGRVKLTDELVVKYVTQLIRYRIKDVQNELGAIYHQVKLLGIPVWIQFVISQIGIAHDWDRGIEFIPVLKDQEDLMSVHDMLLVSKMLRDFTPDGKPFFTQAWPKSKEGNREVMSYAIVDNFVSGNIPEAVPIQTYVAGFLGFKLKEQATFNMLYRINYDRVDDLRAALLCDSIILE